MCLTTTLVTPTRTESVGAAARATKTVEFCDLRIVDDGAHSTPVARWVVHDSGDILNDATTYPILAAALRNVDFTVATTTRSRVRFHYYATPQQLLPLPEEKARWMTHATLVFNREDSRLSNEEPALIDVLAGVPMTADCPSLNPGQSTMVYCCQLASPMQQTAPAATAADHYQLQALRIRIEALLSCLGVEEDAKLVDWLAQQVGLLQQHDMAVLHRSLHGIEKNLPE